MLVSVLYLNSWTRTQACLKYSKPKTGEGGTSFMTVHWMDVGHHTMLKSYKNLTYRHFGRTLNTEKIQTFDSG